MSQHLPSLDAPPPDLICLTAAAKVLKTSLETVRAKLRQGWFRYWIDVTTGRRYVSHAELMARFVPGDSAPRRKGARRPTPDQRRKVQSNAEARRLLKLAPQEATP